MVAGACLKCRGGCSKNKAWWETGPIEIRKFLKMKRFNSINMSNNG